MRIGYVLVGIIILTVFLAVYYYLPYMPLKDFSKIPDWGSRVITSRNMLARKVPEFLWASRGFDILIQATLVVAMAAGMAIFFGKEAGGE